MALDNPSYFTIPGGTSSSISSKNGRFFLLKKHLRMGSGSSASISHIPSTKARKNERYSVLPSASSPGPSSEASAGSSDANLRSSFRSLLRTTSCDGPIQTHMLVLGMPRPSDIAPSSHQTTSSTKRSHTRNASVGKTSVVSGNEASANSRSSKASDHVVENVRLSTANDRYYNMLPGTKFIQNGRRHSIGAYFSRKGGSAVKNENQIQEETSFCDKTAKADLKLAKSGQQLKRKDKEENGWSKFSCLHRPKGGKFGMEDIVIISSSRSQAADLWSKYLKTCFDQIRKNRSKPPFRILSLGIEDSGGFGQLASDLEKLREAKLVIFIICPVFLEYVDQNPETSSNLCKHVRSDGVLAMLLGIGEATITDDHKAALLNYSQWKRMESFKDRDEKFVGDFLGAAMDIILKTSPQANPPSEKGAFMLMPKKVNKSQNKVLVLLNEPITKEDVMRITVVRNNEVFDIPSVKKRNPYTLIFRMPEDFLAVSTLVGIRVERNGTDLGSRLLKCESQLYALVQILKSCDSPIEFMCQALNIVPCDKDKLDDYLVSAFQRNIPPNFNLLQTSDPRHRLRGVLCQEEYPTLLHFAARYGLEKLCWVLLECPGGEVACDIRNACELTPADMAESAGHSKLANALCGYMQMTEFTSVYTFLKGMSDEKNNSVKSDTSDDYLNPRPLSETYQVPPSPRPFAQLYSHTPTGYMHMHSPKSSQSSSALFSQESARNLGSSKEKLFYRKNSGDGLKKYENEIKKSKEHSKNGIQDELVEIINDFKNNVFTISEVEKLVEDWKNRNDVRQSFKEKQEQLNKMREEYERVQQRLKDEMKQTGRPSPMERIRNFFRSKAKDKASEEPGEDKKSRQEEASLLHRPSSGLSIQSSTSSSSGRLSTGSHGSGTSLGDSGTHSDAESEKKFQPDSKCRSGRARVKDGLDNYDIPPNPVCLFGLKSTPPNGISNYDIPPSLSSETGLPRWLVSADDEPCSTSDVQSNEANYYNLISGDLPIPNRSTLHGRLVGAGNKSSLKAVEETVESKNDESNSYEYINLPKVTGQVTADRLLSDANEKAVESTVPLPDYVNFGNSKP